MKKTLTVTTFGLVAAFGMAIGAQADIVNATYGDRHVIQGNFEDGVTADVFLANNSNGRRIGAGGAGGANRVNNPVIEFTLPTLTGGTVISGAEWSLTWDSPAIQKGTNSVGFDGILTLMNYAAVGDFSGADFNDDVSSLGNGSLAGTFTVASVTDGGTVNLSLGAPALALLQSFYTGVNPNQASVFFRLSMDGTHVYTGDRNERYNIETVDTTAGGDLVTSFSITTIPEPATFGLMAVFGGGVMFFRRRYVS